MEDSSGWVKPFIAAFIVLGIVLLVLWVLFQNFANRLFMNISDILFNAGDVFVGPIINYFMLVSRYAVNSSDELYAQVTSSLKQLVSFIGNVSDPVKANLIANLLIEKNKLKFTVDNLSEQSKLNQKIAEAITDDLRYQSDIKLSLDSIDQTLSQSLNNPTLLREKVMVFSTNMMRALFPDLPRN